MTEDNLDIEVKRPRGRPPRSLNDGEVFKMDPEVNPKAAAMQKIIKHEADLKKLGEVVEVYYEETPTKIRKVTINRKGNKSRVFYIKKNYKDSAKQAQANAIIQGLKAKNLLRIA